MATSAVEEWHEFTIDELKADTVSAIAIGPFGSRMKSDCYVSIGVPVIRGNNLSSTKHFTGDFVYITDDKAKELRSSTVVAGDLVFPHRGLIGDVGIVPLDQNQRYVLSTSLMKLTCNRQLVDPDYLFYFFRSPVGRHELLKNSSQVGTPGIATPLASLKSVRLKVPPLPVQRRIAGVLGFLDDKIDLNRRMNETLEAMARAIFKSWFVDFDPVRAKMDGRQPTGIDAETADLFPGSLEQSFLGLIPAGWRPCTWGDLIKLEYGKNLRGYENVQGGYAVFGTNGPIGRHNEALCQHPGIILGRKGAYRGVHFHDEPFFVIDTAYYVEPMEPLELRWGYYQMLREDINGMDSGSAIPSTSRDEFYKVGLAYPPFPIQRRFVDLLSPLWSRQRLNGQESQGRRIKMRVSGRLGTRL